MAKHAHSADRLVDAQRQQYALQIAEFNIQHHTNLSPTKKGIIVYDANTNSVTTVKPHESFHKDRNH